MLVNIPEIAKREDDQQAVDGKGQHKISVEDDLEYGHVNSFTAYQ
jgi:hypothetical protein